MKKKVIIGIIVLIVVLGLIGTATGKKETASTTITQPPQTASEPTIAPPTSTPIMNSPTKLEYKISSRTENIKVENFEVLINPGVDGKAVAMEVKKLCKKPCNIYVYDDEEAIILYGEYESLTTPEELTSWKNDHYVFVADHLIGDVNFETGEYSSYPFRDWQYKELSGNK